MRKRDKILLLLFSVTLAFGGFVLLQSYSDADALIQFRLFLRQPLRNFSDALAANTANVWYGGVALFALTAIAIVFKSVSNAELRAFNDRLVAAQVANAELETLLQDALWTEKHATAAKEAAIRDMESNAQRIIVLEDRLSEAERLLRRREREINGLRAEVGSVTQAPLVTARDSAPSQSEIAAELKETAALLQAKEAALRAQENQSRATIESLEELLAAAEKLSQERQKELDSYRAQLTEAETARRRSESSFIEELRTEQQAAQSRELAAREQEQTAAAQRQELESRIATQDDRLQRQATEIEILKSTANALQAQLTDAAAGKARTERMLHDELAKATGLLHAKDAAFKELQELSQAQLGDLQRRLADKETLQKQREEELDALKTQLTDAGTAKSRTESVLAEELRKEQQAVRAQAEAIKELESRLGAITRGFESRLAEKEQLLQTFSTELETAKSALNVVQGQVAETRSLEARAEQRLEQELANKTELLQSKDAALKALESTMLGRLNDVETRLREKEAALAQRNAEIVSLKLDSAKMTSAVQDNEALRRELSEAAAAARTKQSAVQELENGFNKTIAAFEQRLGEQHTLLQQRDAELAALRAEVSRLKATPGAATADWSLRLLDEPASADPLNAKLTESSQKIQELQSALRDREERLQVHDEKLQRLESELKEKRSELAKHEIAVWQAYERRTLWRQRLAKFGISIKDRGANL